MLHKSKPIKIWTFDNNDPLSELPQSTQVKYLRCYFSDLGASCVLEEPQYFDRDYLSEFASFYSVSSRGYPNICKRLHFFSGPALKRNNLRQATAGSEKAIRNLQKNYLGFIVVRPIPFAPLGRTVVRWYPDDRPNTPRVVEPYRDYLVHLAGIELSVRGLAWQQQDSAVGACATIGVWSMLHSSAFDDHHAIPTTADITKGANEKAALGSRVFPSGGLTMYQICEAIKAQKLSPIILEGDAQLELNRRRITVFSKERFSSSCAAFLRSGYPVLLVGYLEGNGDHAVCVVGFRSCPPPKPNGNDFVLEDTDIAYLYIHDDNLGPSVRFKIHDEDKENYIWIEADAPPAREALKDGDCATDDYPRFIPSQMLVAVHEDLRTSPDALHREGGRKAMLLSQALAAFAQKAGSKKFGLTLSTRFQKLSSYLGKELGNTLKGNSFLLSKVRLALCEKIPPMSLHLGIVRIGYEDASPLVDILYDTTDSDINHPVYACVSYSEQVTAVIDLLESVPKINVKFGTRIIAY